MINFKNIKAKTLNPKDPKVIKAIEDTIREQERVLALKDIDYEKLRNTIITI